MKYLALTLPGGNAVNAPGNIPTGGIGGAGSSIVKTGITLLLITAILLSFGYLVYGGYKWITSAGDQEKLASARMTLLYAIIGLVVCFFSFLIIQTIGAFLNQGANLLSLPTAGN